MKPRPGPRLPHRPHRAAASRGAEAEGFVEHTDGWYWGSADGAQPFGPFDTLADARRDRERGSEQAVDEAAAEREAERERGADAAIEEDLEDRRAQDRDADV